jgi:hypothetical protein
MTEQEYIDATNLAKLRTAKVIVYDCLPTTEHEETHQLEISRALAKWIDHLENKVRLNGQPADSDS